MRNTRRKHEFLESNRDYNHDIIRELLGINKMRYFLNEYGDPHFNFKL